MPTIREVANKAGVSSTTVSHVINHTRFVSEAVRLQVQAAMDQLGYRPNALARSLRRGETHTLGLILPDSANPFFAEVGRSLEDAAFNQGYNLILCNTEGDLAREAIHVDVLIKKQVDGMIFVATGERTDSLEPLARMNLPFVLIDRDLPDLETDIVLTDNFEGGRLVTEYLLQQGHNSIGCISGPSNLTPSSDRINGYRAALQKSGRMVDECQILRGDFNPSSGYEAACRLLSQANRPTAIFACNDMMALGVLRAAAEAGLRVPQELAVVGYDDIELASYTSPALSTIAQPKIAMGQQAIFCLMERMADKTTPPRKIVLPVEFIERGSTRSGKPS